MFYFYKKHRLVTLISMFLGCLFTSEAFPMARPEQPRLVCHAPLVQLLNQKTSPTRPLPDKLYFDHKMDGLPFYQICQLFYGEEVTVRPERNHLVIRGQDEKIGCVPKDCIVLHETQNNDGKEKALVTEPFVQTYFPEKTKCTLFLPMGSVLYVSESDDPEFFQFHDPFWNTKDGTLLIRKKNVKLCAQLKAATEELIRSTIVQQAHKFVGKPYQWGGQTAAGVDCSGLIYTIYTASGQKITRDILHLFDESKLIEPSKIQPGDIIYFYREGYKGGIADHVVLYEGDDFIIESSPKTESVFRTTFEEEYGRSLASCNGEEKFFLYGETYQIGCQSIINK